MYCCHCGKKINEKQLEMKQSSFADVNGEITSETTVGYVCPRCGHIIHANLNEGEVKGLSRAAHAELQRASNSFAIGMGNVSIGGIALIIAFIFFLLARKPGEGNRLVTTCAEFYVSMALFAIAFVLLTIGVIYVSLGISKKRHYSSLLKDINNKTFIQ